MFLHKLYTTTLKLVFSKLNPATQYTYNETIEKAAAKIMLNYPYNMCVSSCTYVRIHGHTKAKLSTTRMHIIFKGINIVFCVFLLRGQIKLFHGVEMEYLFLHFFHDFILETLEEIMPNKNVIGCVLLL